MSGIPWAPSVIPQPLWLRARPSQPSLPTLSRPAPLAGDGTWLSRYAHSPAMGRALSFLAPRPPARSASFGLQGALQPAAAAGYGGDTAAAGRRAVVSAQGQLATFSAWSRSAEGRAYAQWRNGQERLPEAMRQTGTWGTAAGLNGVLRGNKPQVAWKNHAAGQVWRYRCNVFASNHTYLAGFSVPVVTRPDDMVTRYRAEIAGRRRADDNLMISRYFDEVPVSQIRPGDWVMCGRKRNGRMEYRHVVLAASSWQGDTLRIAQAGATPKPDQTTLVARDGRFRSVNDAGRTVVNYEELVVLRPKRLRPTGPDGQPVRDAHA